MQLDSPRKKKGILMNILAAIVLGLLVGWLIEWVIDWFYWRNRIHAVVGKTLKDNEQLSDQNVDLIRANKDLDEANADLKERVRDMEAEINQIKASAKIAHLLNKDGSHNFQSIKGIGPAFSKRLNDAGITTFEQLSQLTPQDMERILGILYKRFFAKENTILQQAKDFAKLIATAQERRKV